MIGIRIALEHLCAVLLDDAELVNGILLELKGEIGLPHAVFADFFEGMFRFIPFVEVSHKGNRLSVRRPDTACHACLIFIRSLPQTHVLISLHIGSLMEQIKRDAVAGVDFLLHGNILLLCMWNSLS